MWWSSRICAPAINPCLLIGAVSVCTCGTLDWFEVSVMPKQLIIEVENLPPVVRGWLKAANLGELDTVELVFTDREVLLRKPRSAKFVDWANPVVDEYDKAFRKLAGLE
jgi:hypothetical protein